MSVFSNNNLSIMRIPIKPFHESVSRTGKMKAERDANSPWYGQCRPQKFVGTMDPDIKLAYS